MPAAQTEEATTFVRVASYPGSYPAEKRGESLEELDNGWEILAHVNMYLGRKKQCELVSFLAPKVGCGYACLKVQLCTAHVLKVGDNIGEEMVVYIHCKF